MPALKILKKKINSSSVSSTAGLYATFWLSGVGMAVAVYSYPFPTEFLILGYLLILCSIVLPILKIALSNGKWLRPWKLFLYALFLLAGLYGARLIYGVQVSRELSQMKGLLIPGKYPLPEEACPGLSPSPRALAVFFGSQVAYTEGNRMRVIFLRDPRAGESPYDPVLLGIDRMSDGTIALHANIEGKDGKFIARVDKNTFEISRNRLLDPFSPPRQDKSTIKLTDEDGNELMVRFLNPRAVLFFGKLYFRPNQWVEIGDDGMRVQPNGFRIANFCYYFSGPRADDGGIFQAY